MLVGKAWRLALSRVISSLSRSTPGLPAKGRRGTGRARECEGKRVQARDQARHAGPRRPMQCGDAVAVIRRSVFAADRPWGRRQRCGRASPAPRPPYSDPGSARRSRWVSSIWFRPTGVADASRARLRRPGRDGRARRGPRRGGVRPLAGLETAAQLLGIEAPAAAMLRRIGRGERSRPDNGRVPVARTLPSGPALATGSNCPWVRASARHFDSVAGEIPTSCDSCRGNILCGGSTFFRTATFLSGE